MMDTSEIKIRSSFEKKAVYPKREGTEDFWVDERHHRFVITRDN